MKYNRHPRVFRFLTILLVIVPTVGAFELQPMSATIDPASSSPTVNFDVINTTDAPVAVQMRATTRRIDRDGTEFNEDAADRLQVFPTQLILRPGQRQAVRVRWIGGGVPREELPFRIVAEQLPINLSREDDAASGVRMMLRYRATLYVRPAGAAPDLRVAALGLDETGEAVQLTIENRGTAHQLLSEGLLVLSGPAGQQELRMDEVETLAAVNMLPGSVRRITLAREDLPVVPDEISFRFDR
jgi:fimbrial chaperone protein